MEYSWLFVAYPMFLCSFFVASDENGCPETSFIGCVTRIRLKRVPFDTNMLNVVFNVTSEAKLRQTCIAYGEALPCFRDRILQCGNDKQKRLLDEVAKIIKFFCSAASTQTQQIFLKHGSCIGKVLQMPATNDCYMTQHPDGKKLDVCRQVCYERKEFLCMMKIWVSEQSLCTLIDTERNCGQEAGEFYQKLQTNVFTDSFPIICDYSTPIVNHSIIPVSQTSQTSTVSIPTTIITSLPRPVEASTLPFTTELQQKFTPPSSLTTPKYIFKFGPTSVLPKKNVPDLNETRPELNHTHSLSRPDHQFNRIVEVTVVPPSLEVASTNQGWQPIKSHTVKKPDSNVNYNYPVVVDTSPTTSTTIPETQTFWRPWYLKGVGYNFETTEKPTTTEATIIPKSISLNELFSFDTFKKLKTNKERQLDMNGIQSLTGNNDFGSRKNTDFNSFGWPFWSSSSTTSKLSCIFLLVSVIFVKLF